MGTLRKLISIRNVGRFLNYNAVGDVELRRYNLLFAENGRGKTTLCAIFRSIMTGDAAMIRGRTSLGATGVPEIRILPRDGQPLVFSAGAWNGTIPNLAIFDSMFVAENVYSGEAVALDQRRRLYGVIVGKVGADLARRIDELDDSSRQKATEIREKRAAVQALASGVAVDAFMALPADPQLDAKIVAKESELAALRQAEQIRQRTELSPVTLPVIPEGITTLLAKTLDGVSADAAARVSSQIRKHQLMDAPVGWLQAGVHHIRENDCPFCGQNLGGVDLIAAYRTYFSIAYSELGRSTTTMRQRVESALNDRMLAGVERTLDQNVAAVEFWSAYCQITRPVIAAGVGDALRALREAALALLDRKAAAPLDAIAPDAAFHAATEAVTALHETASVYNDSVTSANAVIAARKQATHTADARALQAELNGLRAAKSRHEAAGAAACKELQTALEEKDALDREKDTIKKKLDDYARDVMGQYETTMNRLLGEFQAGFGITGTSQSYTGGAVSSSYQLVINDTAVDLGSADTALDTPSFRNTLSSGDKSTLALAFFLAQLEHDDEKANKIVVFDDPFTSQNVFRQDCTIQKIKRCGATCAQVIVLSHDPDFLKRIWDRLEPADRKTLKLARVGTRDTTILDFDIEEATQAVYKAQRKLLLDFYHESKGDPRDVVQKIRPVLETYCKFVGGGVTADNDTLGVIIGKIRAAGAGHQLFQLVDDLEGLNEYTKRYHHGENINAATEPISDAELQGKVALTLQITGGV
jgi:wobble nucleotide-excising tRNase